MAQRGAPSFSFIGRDVVLAAVRGRERHYINTVAESYLLHAQGIAKNPVSSFLRIPGRAPDRAIALPAFLGGDRDIWGVKWISSVPGNVENSLPRASGVIVLNKSESGFPFACVEAGVINAVRTAAAATLGARYLSLDGPTECVLGIIGVGLIAKSCLSYLLADSWKVRRVLAFDLDRSRAASLRRDKPFSALETEVCDSIEQVIRGSDIILFATTAIEPYVADASLFEKCPTVLHVSLRDLGTEVIGRAQNVVDDVGLSLSEGTSLQRAEAALGNRDFVDGTIAEMMTGLVRSDSSRPRIFSPFGMGILDIAVAEEIYRYAASNGLLTEVSGFFGPDSNLVL